MLLFLSIFLLLFAYLGIRVAFSLLPRKQKLRRIAFALVLFLSVPALQFLLHGAALPRPFLLAAVWLDNALLLTVPLLLLAEIPYFLCAVCRKKFPHRIVVLSVLGIAAVLSIVSEISALACPQVRRMELTVPDLPREFDGYQAVFLADLHFCKITNPHLAGYLSETVNALHPDLILLGGDYADGEQEYWEPYLRRMSELRAADGVFAIPGNHEYFYGYRNILDSLARCGAVILENSHVIIRRGEHAAIAVAGLTDRTALRYPPEKRPGATPDLQTALAGIPEHTPVILLAHQPGQARRNAEDGRIALQLSGHTHGGMIAGIPQWIVASSNGGFVSGLYDVGTMRLYVSNGTSLWNSFSCRLGVPPEITLFTLRRF